MADSLIACTEDAHTRVLGDALDAPNCILQQIATQPDALRVFGHRQTAQHDGRAGVGR